MKENSNRKVVTCLVSLVVILVSLNDLFAQEYSKIGSFNIAEFGEGSHPATRDLDYIAEMLVSSDLDLIAIQELGTAETALSQVDALMKKMNDQATDDFTYYSVVTPTSGDERCAIIYRFPMVFEDEFLWLDEDKNPADSGDGGETFYRIPVAIPFHANNFDFYIVIVHLSWGNLDRREDEFIELRKFLRANDDEEDWIVLGDFNRYGKRTSGSKKGFDRLLTSGWKSNYRFPLLEAITEPDNMKVFQASQDEHSTTIAGSKNLYDQFIITQGAYNEFDSTNPVLGTDVGILPFDMEARFSSLGHNDIKYQISDHRPIWMRFRTDLADDD